MSDAVDQLVDRAENPDEIDLDLCFLLAQTDFDQLPHRHPDKLKKAYQDCDSISQTAARLGTNADIIRRWLHVWGIYTREQRHQKFTFAQKMNYLGDADD